MRKRERLRGREEERGVMVGVGLKLNYDVIKW